MSKPVDIGETVFSGMIAMQYTGFKDKNGKEIYEHDTGMLNESRGAAVERCSGDWVLLIKNGPKPYRLSALHRDFEVTGNKFE